MKLARAIIRRAIKDLGTGDIGDFYTARCYIDSPAYPADCKRAGYPDELHEALKEMTTATPVQRKHLSKEILTLLKETWG